MKVTKREILCSIAIACIMLVFGLLIQQSIRTAVTKENKKYETAIEIEDPATFKYAMQTNVGNAFVYGDLKTVDPVSVEEIDGEWMWVEKVTEKHTRHQRTITKKVGKNTVTEIQYYWTWDRVGTKTWHCEKISFLESEFDYGTISVYGSNYIRCDGRGSYRDKWYTGSLEHTGTIFTNLHDGTIEKTELSEGKDIEQLKKELIKSTRLYVILFWIFWSLLTGVLIFCFCYLDNYWLE